MMFTWLFGKDIQLAAAWYHSIQANITALLYKPKRKYNRFLYTNGKMVQLTRRHRRHNVQRGSTATLIFLCLLSNLVPSKHDTDKHTWSKYIETRRVYVLWVCFLVGATPEVTPGHDECVCPGDKLTYWCTVHGEATGATIWNGTAFSGCQPDPDEILLQHSRFTTTGSTGICNNGSIVGQSLSVQGSNYTSQLNVIITPDTVGKTVKCAYDALSSDQTQDMIKVSTIVPGNPAW